MADSYYGKCALCTHLDLYDKSYGKYYCPKLKTYFTVFEPQCNTYFEPAHPLDERIEMVEKAREGKL
ncbi:MAG: hypothetical protein IJ406_07320 [Oscillospiraceae bacterium]|nr:hypothetical protein [Oscillospiraceae bacterium]